MAGLVEAQGEVGLHDGNSQGISLDLFHRPKEYLPYQGKNSRSL